MNSNPFITIMAGLAASLGTSALAIEAPADNAPPPSAAGSPAGEVTAPKPVANEAVAFLGVVAAEMPAMLAEHLGLKAGDGIVVRALMPDGPAAKAGIAVHDIITRIAKQAVGTAADLTKQVAACKPGDKLQLELIHQGKPVAIEVTLGTRPVGTAAMAPGPLDQLDLDGLPKDLAKRIRGAIEGNLGELEIPPGEDGLGIAPQPKVADALREMQQRMEQAMQGLNAQGLPGGSKLEVQQGASFRLMDEQGSIELKANDGSKEVTIRNKDNKITWSGPWDTEQDKAAAPAEVRQRVERLHFDSTFQGNGLRLQLRPDNLPPNGGE